MLITAAAILFILAALSRPLRQGFYALHSGLVLASLWLYAGHGGEPFSAASLKTVLIAHLVWINVTLFAAYAYDKKASRKGAWRIRENSLHAMALLGGTIGGFAASRIFRHKTKKTSFRVGFWLVTLLQVMLLIMLYKISHN